MGYQVFCVKDDGEAVKVREDLVSRWRSECHYFLNKRDCLILPEITSTRDIDKIKYKIRSEAIYSNHYDGVVVLDLSSLQKITNEDAVSDLISFVSKECAYGEYLLIVNRSKCGCGDSLADSITSMMERTIRGKGGINLC